MNNCPLCNGPLSYYVNSRQPRGHKIARCESCEQYKVECGWDWCLWTVGHHRLGVQWNEHSPEWNIRLVRLKNRMIDLVKGEGNG